MSTHRYRVYINPFDAAGNYAGYQEVTDDVEFDGLGELAQDLDNTDYDIGIYRTNNVSITFRNDSGKYSDVDQPQSIFSFKRVDSLVKITYMGELESPRAGFFKADSASPLADEIVLFIGLLNDESLSMDLDTQKLTFQLMGRENILTRTNFPFTSLWTVSQTFTVTIASPGVFTTPSPHGLVVGNPVAFTTTGALPGGLTVNTPYYVASIPTNSTFTVSDTLSGSELNTTGSQSGTHTINLLFGQSLQTLIRGALNQTPITNLLTVSNANLNVGLDQTIDNMSDLFNKTVWDAVTDLLLITNSVLYVKNDSIFVAPRTPTASVQFHFFGQASSLGPENIQNVKMIKNGLSRTFNYLSWDPSQIFVSNVTSISKYTSRPKTLSFTYLSTPSKQTSALSALLSDFGLPKQEFELYTPFNYLTEAIELLDRVDIDYPTVHLPGDFPLPICGVAICGTAVTPEALWAFVIDQTSNYKVLGKALDTKTSLYKLKLRKI